MPHPTQQQIEQHLAVMRWQLAQAYRLEQAGDERANICGRFAIKSLANAVAQQAVA